MFGWFQSLVSIRFQELSQLRRELRKEANKSVRIRTSDMNHEAHGREGRDRIWSRPFSVSKKIGNL